MVAYSAAGWLGGGRCWLVPVFFASDRIFEYKYFLNTCFTLQSGFRAHTPCEHRGTWFASQLMRYLYATRRLWSPHRCCCCCWCSLFHTTTTSGDGTWEEGGGACDDDTAQVSLTVCELVPSDDYYYPLRSIAKLVLFLPHTLKGWGGALQRLCTNVDPFEDAGWRFSL